MLDARLRAFIEAQRVARLATVDEHGRPHLVPVCFALDGEIVYSVLDAKPKSVPLTALRRVRNILVNPNVQVLFDRYDEDWSRLAYVQLRGSAGLVQPSQTEHKRALVILRRRYPQYAAMELDQSPVIRVEVTGAVGWGDLPRT
jgi:PPOX class probable F420-dependent enzyme